MYKNQKVMYIRCGAYGEFKGGTFDPVVTEFKIIKVKNAQYVFTIGSGDTEGKLNALNRWGSTSLVMSQQVIGCVFFDVLRRVLEASFPNWNAGLPIVNDGDNDD